MDAFEITRGIKSITIQPGDNASSGEEEVMWAADLLARLVQSPKYCQPGHRNDSMVDTMICLKLLDVPYGRFLADIHGAGWINTDDLAACIDKCEIIDDYADGWVDNSLRVIETYCVAYHTVLR